MSESKPKLKPLASLSAFATPSQKATLLAVDDDRTMLMMLTHALEMHGHKVLTARSGEEALTTLQKHIDAIDTLILDREMPGLSGLEVVAKIKSSPQLSAIPIIMLTGSGNPEQIQQGIEAGVFYYLVKPASDAVLRSVVNSALRERGQKRALLRELNRHDAALKAMRSCQIDVKTLTEAEDAACFLASCFPEPERVVSGLMELLVNAVEHGNLGITYEEKSQLISENRWREEVSYRLTLPEHASKVAEVTFQRKNEGWYVQISDKGKGFDWRRYWQIDQARATASHGRGIARARLMAFDKLAYNEAGNQVTAAIEIKAQKNLDW